MGRAGNARLRALSAIPAYALAGTVSRRSEAGTRTLEDVLADQAVEAVAVSTEPADHAVTVQKALAAGKHVLCDYPLALSASAARALFDLADKQRRLLHVEHIGLLTDAHASAKRALAERGRLIDGQFTFTGGWSEQLADERRHGPFPFLATSRLLQIADLFGPFTILEHEWHADARAGRLELRLRFARGGGTLTFLEDRRMGEARTRRMQVRLTRGTFQWPEETTTRGLFAKDLRLFYDAVRHGTPPYAPPHLITMVLAELERLL